MLLTAMDADPMARGQGWRERQRIRTGDWCSKQHPKPMLARSQSFVTRSPTPPNCSRGRRLIYPQQLRAKLPNRLPNRQGNWQGNWRLNWDQAFTSTTTRPCTWPFRISAPNCGKSESTAGLIIASSFSIGRSVASRSQARSRLS
mgnify:FL=1